MNFKYRQTLLRLKYVDCIRIATKGKNVFRMQFAITLTYLINNQSRLLIFHFLPPLLADTC